VLIEVIPGLFNLVKNSRDLFIAFLYKKLGISLWFLVVLGEISSYTILESQIGFLLVL
jgi:hypothetical protein